MSAPHPSRTPSAQESIGLSRTLKSRHLSMISIGGIVGAGLFVGSSAAIASVGPAAVVSYALAGLIVMVVMRMLSEMVATTPGLGSLTEYIRLALGDWAGFASGWLYWYSWVIVVAIEALAGARLLQEWIDLPVWKLVLLLMLTLTSVNLLSSRSYAEFEFWLASIKVAAIVLFILIVGSFALGLTSTRGPTFANLVDHGGFAPFGWVSVLAGMTTVIFSMCGAEMVTIASAESNEPARVVSRMTTSIIVRILLFYVVSVLLIVTITPWIEVRAGNSPFALALEHAGVPGAATIMSLVVLTAVLSCLNSGLYVTSRILFALAAKGEAPRGLLTLNRRRVPARAILLGSSLGFGAVILSIFAPNGLFAFLVNASGALMIFVYLFICFAHIKLRREFEKDNPARLTVKVWLFPWVSWLTMGAMVGVLGAMATKPDLASQLYASIGALGTVLAGYWLVRTRRRDRGAASEQALQSGS